VPPTPTPVPPTPTPSLNASLDTSEVNASGNVPLTTGGVSVYVSGGTPPYHYYWYADGWDHDLNVDGQGGSNTTFTYTGGVNTFSAFFYCVVTDSDFNQVNTEDVQVDINATGK
jgi:hypothetical protein